MSDENKNESGELKALEAALREKRKVREALESKAQEAKRIRELKEQIAAEERAIQDAEIVERLEADLGPENQTWRRVTTEFGMVAVKFVRIAYKGWRDKGAKMDTVALDNLVKLCLVHPTKDEFNAMLDVQPFILDRAANAVAWLAGVREEVVAGK